MPNFVMTRVGKESREIAELLSSKVDPLGEEMVTIRCRQVPKDVEKNTCVFLWLGSDNDKGTATAWKQGLRAIGLVEKKEGGGAYHEECTLEVRVKLTLEHSVDKLDMLRYSSSAYYWLSTAPIIGVNAFSNQTVQAIHEEEETQDVRALIYLLSVIFDDFSDKFRVAFPELASLLDYYPPDPSGAKRGDGPEIFPQLDSEDPLLKDVKDLIRSGHKSFLFLGPPGTGKTYCAHRLANSLAGAADDQIEIIQFHQKFSYDDFVEGYIPNPDNEGAGAPFKLKPKVFRQICERAQNNPDKPYILVIDELNRGDPSRVFGEVLTYIEDDYRETEFRLAYSGLTFSVPSNVYILATMNPYDHSVADLDAALDRRFMKFAFEPDGDLLAKSLEENGVEEDLRGEVVELFEELQKVAPYGGLGHSFFMKIRNRKDVKEVWDRQLKFIFNRIFWDDSSALEQVDDLVRSVIDEKGGREGSVLGGE